MPVSVRSPYRNIALVKLTPEFAAAGLRPAMLSIRARGVEEIEHLGHHFVGKTDKAAYQTTLARAEAIVASRNAPNPSPLRADLEQTLIDYVKLCGDTCV
jgi:hypothetical protein